MEYKTEFYLKIYNMNQIAFLDCVYDTIKHNKLSIEYHRVLILSGCNVHQLT